MSTKHKLIEDFLLKKRIIKIDKKIDSELAENVINLLHYYDTLNNDTVYLHINSYGGVCHDALAIYDTTQYIKSKVCTIVCGAAMSAGAFLLTCCGSEGMRHATPNSKIMFHSASWGREYDTASEMLIRAQEGKNIEDLMISIVAKHTKKDLSFIKDLFNKTNYFTPIEAIEYGLIDSLYVKKDEETNTTEKELDKIKEILRTLI